MSSVHLDLDALIVGAGFSGIYILHRLHSLHQNLRVKIIDAGSEPGGTWHWNRYPGARVDCPIPSYSFAIEDVYKDWKWSELYPGRDELRAYFRHVSRALDISKDCLFGMRVKSARFDGDSGVWTVYALDKDGGEMVVRAKYFVPAVGFAAQSYVPPWKGIESFRGEIHHSSSWPEGSDVRGKRVAVIGTGASGVQIIQEWAKEAAETIVFQRTPNLCCPMGQERLDGPRMEEIRKGTADEFATCWTTNSGLPYGPPNKLFADYSQEECEAALNALYDKGGFSYWQGAYLDLLANPEGNRLAYDIWAKRTRARVQDPAKRDLLAPLEPPHPFGTKRPCLEQDYYEQFNRPSVHIVDTSTNPITEFVPEGIRTQDGKLYKVDTIALATGFNSSTGSLEQMDIRGLDGKSLGDRWKDGVETFLGMTVPGFPNMFLPYGAQAPTAFTNGPIFIEFQADWIRDVIRKMESDGKRIIDTRPEVAKAWGDEIQAISNMTLFPLTKSWYMGANIPGKHVEQLYYLGGLPLYRTKCTDALGEKFEECFVCQ